MKRLQPSDMRRGPVFMQAYVFYALILTFIYLVICIYASVPFLQQVIGLDIAGLDLLGGTAGAKDLPDSATLATGASFDDAGARRRSGRAPTGRARACRCSSASRSSGWRRTCRSSRGWRSGSGRARTSSRASRRT